MNNVPAGATGGWAGGEPGLQKFLESLEGDANSNMTSKGKSEKSTKPRKVGEGKDKIYVGFDYKYDILFTRCRICVAIGIQKTSLP